MGTCRLCGQGFPDRATPDRHVCPAVIRSAPRDYSIREKLYCWCILIGIVAVSLAYANTLSLVRHNYIARAHLPGYLPILNTLWILLALAAGWRYVYFINNPIAKAGFIAIMVAFGAITLPCY